MAGRMLPFNRSESKSYALMLLTSFQTLPYSDLEVASMASLQQREDDRDIHATI